ncbi:hypothetical protein Tco_1170179 [Tanacetum coccineum]
MDVFYVGIHMRKNNACNSLLPYPFQNYNNLRMKGMPGVGIKSLLEVTAAKGMLGVRIKSLLEVTAAKVCVTAAK